MCKKPSATINLSHLEIWPFWSYPKFTTLLSYERAGQKSTVPVIMGKTSTFEDEELNFHLHDQNGNEVPVKQIFARLTIND